MDYGILDTGIFSKGDLDDEYLELGEKNPAMVAMIQSLRYKIASNLIVTSIYRSDPDSTHHYWRAVDFRLHHIDRDVESRFSGPGTEEIVPALLELSDQFRYDDLRNVYRIHGVGFNRHLHLQTKGLGRWIQQP